MKKNDPLLFIGAVVLFLTAVLNLIRIIISPDNIIVPAVNLIAVAGALVFIFLTLDNRRNRWLQIAVLCAAQSPANAVVMASEHSARTILLLFLIVYGAMITCVWTFKKKKLWVIAALVAEVLMIIGSVMISADIEGTLNKASIIASMPITWLCMIIIYIRRQLEKISGVTDANV